MTKKKILFVNAAGGAVQLEACSGAMLALEESGVLEDADLYYRASSGGAPVAMLHASGVSASRICELIKSIPFNELVMRPWNSRYYSLEGVYNLLCSYMPKEPLENCYVAVYDCENKKGRMVKATPITGVISISVPGVTITHTINEIRHTDCGIVSMVPTCSILEAQEYDRIYMLLAPYDPEPTPSKLPEIIQLLLNTRDAEEYQILNEDRWQDLPNVTVLRTELPLEARNRNYLKELFSWSPGHCVLDAAYNNAKGVLMS